ncbi:FAD-binding oxidoreductase [Streptosporangium sp. NPDC023825]|uniref:FAD-binding oxidoreductase n=1 Tax=Streptosporangium sp. NPDC023825 TaxID=3154909 RepID=UPI003426A54E
MKPDLSTLPRELRDKIVTPEDRRYGMLRSTYVKVSRPAAVLVPETTEEVVAALRFVRERGLPLAVRSGGHGLSGRASNDGGLVIDLSAMNGIEVLDRRTRTVRIQAGARWAQVAAALAPYGLAISSGDHGNVGAGGLATGGGIGWMVRQYGLTIDHIRAVEMVLADGRVVRADEHNEPDLFWAVRGAGARAGILVAFEIEAMELRNVGYVQIVVEVDRDGRTLRRWADLMASAPRELTTATMLMPYGNSLAFSIAAVVASESPRRIRAAVEPLLGLGVNLLDQSAQIIPYPALVSTAHLHANVGQQPVVTTSGFLPTMTDEDAAAITRAAVGPHRPLIQLRSMGGAVSDVPPDVTAFAHRRHGALLIGNMFPPGGAKALDAAWRGLALRVEGEYVGFESRPGRQAFARVYPGAVGERVSEVWRRYDPDGVFGAFWA